MFGSPKSAEDSKKNAPASASSSLNALAKGTSMEGDLHCDSDLRVDGSIKGKLLCKAKVIIGPTGSVQGEIRCETAVIEGRFTGILVVNDLLNVRETAEIDGDITTNKLMVQSGARFNVSCKMDIGDAHRESKNGIHAPSTAKVSGGKA